MSLPSRKNAKIGDYVIVTGDFGSSRAGLEILESYKKYNKDVPEEIKKEISSEAHINPVSRIKEGRIILPTEQPEILRMMDTSEWACRCVKQNLHFSNIGMMINYSSIPYDKDLIPIAEDETKLSKIGLS